MHVSKFIRNLLLKTGIFAAAFLIGGIVTFNIINKPEIKLEKVSVYKATLPVLSMLSGGNTVNTLYAYSNEMDVKSLRSTVYICGKDRNCDFSINTYSQRINEISFELRSVKTGDLIEKTEVKDVKESDGKISGSLSFKDLMEYDDEYMLCIVVKTFGKGDIRFYTRVLCTEDEDMLNINRHIDFVRGFHDMTFEKNSLLNKYLENSRSENGTFSYVDINSSFKYVTWQGLEIETVSDAKIDVYDVHGKTASISVSYVISIASADGKKYYKVCEKYFTRCSGADVFLIDFRRNTDLLLMGDDLKINGNSLDLGFNNSEIEIKENGSGNIIAFVNEGRLFVLQLSENKLTEVFGFYDSAEDERGLYGDVEIRILRMDEVGNITFSVTGYMSGGIHEGKTGMAVYDFDMNYNTISERIFIPSNQPEDILINFMGVYTHLANNGFLYTLIGDSLYKIDLYKENEYTTVSLADGAEFKTSESGAVIAVQNDPEDISSGIKVINLNDDSEKIIEGKEGEGVKILGFIEEDLVYGYVKEEDIKTDVMGQTLYPCHKVFIQDEKGDIITEYTSGTYRVESIQSEADRIILNRVSRFQGGSYIEAPTDIIMASEEREAMKNEITEEETELGEVKKLKLYSPIDGEKTAHFRAAAVYELSYGIDIDSSLQKGSYICYDHGKVEGIYTKAGEAVKRAYELCGQVVDESSRYVYYRGNITRRNQIMSLTRNVDGRDFSSESSLVSCINEIINYEGGTADTARLLSENRSVTDILQSSLTTANILDLEGCPLRAMTFYLDLMCDFPVLARMPDADYVLLLGFNDTDVVVFNPKRSDGNVYHLTIAEASEMFEEAGNHFVSYIK